MASSWERGQREVAKLKRRCLRLERLEDRRLLALVTVTTDLDIVDFEDGVTSLREAIFATNVVPGADTIRFDFGDDQPAKILLTLGELEITDNLTIEGPGAELVTIDASGNDPTPDLNNGDGTRVFRITPSPPPVLADPPLNVLISGVTLTGGDTSLRGGAISQTNANLTLHESIVSGNASGVEGGGVYTFNGGLTIESSVIRDNEAVTRGGGVSIGLGNLVVERSTIANNELLGNNSDGGGIYRGGGRRAIGQLELRESIVSGNRAVRGGGIYANSPSGTVTISRSIIRQNTARLGGGIFSSSSNSAIEITDSDVSENIAIGQQAMGGGICLIGDRAQPVIIRNSRIVGNRALGPQPFDGTGGGIVAPNAIQLIDSIVSGNSAKFLGGGVHISGASPLTLVSSIVRSTFHGNTAGNSGGGIANQPFSTETRLFISDSTFSENVAGESGGAMAIDGSTSLINTTLSRNVAGASGGAIRTRGGLELSHSTVTLNSAGMPGGGVAAMSGAVRIDHSIVADNTAPLPSPQDLFVIATPQFVATHSLIGSNLGTNLMPSPAHMPDDNGNLIGGPTRNLWIDPLLAPLADNGGPTLTHALLPGSPAINAGDPNAMPGQDGVPEHDQRGAPFTRSYGGRIDIGAFESQPADVLPGDYNGDSTVNAADYVVWRNAMGGLNTAETHAADGNGDGAVDAWDYRLWRNNFGSTRADLPTTPTDGVGGAMPRQSELQLVSALDTALLDPRPAGTSALDAARKKFPAAAPEDDQVLLLLALEHVRIGSTNVTKDEGPARGHSPDKREGFADLLFRSTEESDGVMLPGLGNET